MSGDSESDRLHAAVIELNGETFLVLSLPFAPLELEKLTPAERAVVLAARAGRSNAEIAKERGCALRTVANQMASAFRKLNVSSRADLVARPLS